MIKPQYADPLEQNVDGREQLKTVTDIRDILTEEGLAWFNAERVPGATARWRTFVRGLSPIRHTDGVILVGHNDDGACEMIYFVPSLDTIQVYHTGCRDIDHAKDIQFDKVEHVLDYYQNDCGGTDVIAFDAHTGARKPELDLP